MFDVILYVIYILNKQAFVKKAYNGSMKSYYDHCTLCPRWCRADRTERPGFCGAGVLPSVNLYTLHYGEEPIISGKEGSGAVFFEGCNLKCCFCQNYEISRGETNSGKRYDARELAGIYLKLQARHANNINLVTPMHYAPTIAESVRLAKEGGLNIPVAVNSSGYDLPGTIKLFEGLADIFIPDLKFYSAKLAARYCNAPHYFETACLAIDTMVKIAGSPELDSRGMLKRGVIVRHLMMPGALFDTKHILDYLVSRYGDKIYISLMGQYTPMPQVLNGDMKHPELCRTLSPDHYKKMTEYLAMSGQQNAFVQDEGASGDEFIPDFT